MKTCRKGLHQYDEMKPECPLCKLDSKRRYNHSAKGKACKRRYKQSAKGKASDKRWYQSAKGLAYRQSTHSRAYQRLYDVVIGQAKRSAYHRAYFRRKMAEDPEYCAKRHRKCEEKWRAQGRRKDRYGWTGLSMRLKKEMGLE